MTKGSGRVSRLSQAEPVVSALTGFDPARNCRRCPDGDRPAREPGGMECGRCGCIFIGEEWHGFCAVCIAAVAREIADSQGESSAIAMEASGRDGETRLDPKDDSAGPKDIAQSNTSAPTNSGDVT